MSFQASTQQNAVVFTEYSTLCLWVHLASVAEGPFQDKSIGLQPSIIFISKKAFGNQYILVYKDNFRGWSCAYQHANHHYFIYKRLCGLESPQIGTTPTGCLTDNLSSKTKCFPCCRTMWHFLLLLMYTCVHYYYFFQKSETLHFPFIYYYDSSNRRSLIIFLANFCSSQSITFVLWVLLCQSEQLHLPIDTLKIGSVVSIVSNWQGESTIGLNKFLSQRELMFGLVKQLNIWKYQHTQRERYSTAISNQKADCKNGLDKGSFFFTWYSFYFHTQTGWGNSYFTIRNTRL